MKMVSKVSATLGLVPVLALAAACSDSKDNAGSGTVVTIAVSDDECAVSPASVAAGSVTFTATNAASDTVDEVELIQGSKILGEREGLTKGKSGSFSLRLDGGTYSIFCPGATANRTPFTVTGAGSSAAPLDAAAGQAYKDYVLSEIALLKTATKTFVDAVVAGDLEKSKASFAAARYHYETIEPVAESFGDLDPKIDARADDVEQGQTWTGFHRIEKALWVDKSLAGMAPIANQLTTDVNDLATKVEGESFASGQIANGSVELLQEVATSKITGEEDRYSHTDLSDFEANVQGAQEGFNVVRPALELKDKALAAQIATAFHAVNDALSAYKKDGVYLDYSTVAEADRKLLTQKVDALAEPLSKVAALVA